MQKQSNYCNNYNTHDNKMYFHYLLSLWNFIMFTYKQHMLAFNNLEEIFTGVNQTILTNIKIRCDMIANKKKIHNTE